MAALFGVDAFGGGFLTDALIAFWFFRRFGVQESSLAALFFAARLLSASSYVVAAWLSRQIGMVNTMVFTHLPSNLLLILATAVPTAPLAAALYLLREGLNEMDVPVRQSYVIAMVQEGERTLATGMTNLARNAARAAAAPVAGYVMASLALWSPLVLGSGVKILYDLLLYRAFRHARPPEERGSSTPALQESEASGDAR
jgi:predicted MFS family arabinose efflux permease